MRSRKSLILLALLATIGVAQAQSPWQPLPTVAPAPADNPTTPAKVELGKMLWTRSLAVEVGLVTTHGGRTVSPIVHDNLVIVSGVSTGWGDLARAAHRFMAFDKKTGEYVYISTPGGRPFDTTYSPPIIAEVKGAKLLIAGGGDGTSTGDDAGPLLSGPAAGDPVVRSSIWPFLYIPGK